VAVTEVIGGRASLVVNVDSFDGIGRGGKGSERNAGIVKSSDSEVSMRAGSIKTGIELRPLASLKESLVLVTSIPACFQLTIGDRAAKPLLSSKVRGLPFALARINRSGLHRHQNND